MTTRLRLYNEALMICGERALATPTEEREPRRLLDHVWDNDGVKSCLESGQWKFAMRTIRLDYDPSVSTDFGYRRAFLKPSDWCLTSALCSDEYFSAPLLQYVDEAGYWYADLDTIFVRYISNAAEYGGDLSTWSAKFSEYVGSYFASKIILKLTSDENKRTSVIDWSKRKLHEAKSKDAMAEPTKFPAPGSWVSARGGRSRRDRGSRNSLIG